MWVEVLWMRCLEEKKRMTHSRADLLNDENAVKDASSFWSRA